MVRRIAWCLLITASLLVGSYWVLYEHFHSTEILPVPPAQRLSELLVKANQGDSNAQAEVGKIFLLAKGDKASEDEALRWLQRAAAAGNRDAQIQLSLLYKQGDLVSRDSVIADKGSSSDTGGDPAMAAIQRLDALLTQRTNVAGGNSIEAMSETEQLVKQISGYKDPRSLNVLLRALREQGGTFPGLVDLGPIALDPLIAMTHDPGVRYRAHVYWTLARYVDKDHLSTTLSDLEIKNKLTIFFSDCNNDTNSSIGQTCKQCLDKINSTPEPLITN